MNKAVRLTTLRTAGIYCNKINCSPYTNPISSRQVIAGSSNTSPLDVFDVSSSFTHVLSVNNTKLFKMVYLITKKFKKLVLGISHECESIVFIYVKTLYVYAQLSPM